MKTASEYRAMAEECFKWAREAQDDEVRVSLKQLAQVWLDAASKLDGMPPTRTRSTPRSSSEEARRPPRYSHFILSAGSFGISGGRIRNSQRPRQQA